MSFIKKYKVQFLFFVIPFIIFFSTELIWRHNFTELINWALESKIQFFSGYLITLSVFTILTAITQRLTFSTIILGAICYLISIANYFKSTARSEPLYPLDLFMISEAGGITAFIEVKLDYYLIISFLLIVIAVAISFLAGKTKLQYRMVMCIIGLCIFYLFSFSKYFKFNMLNNKFNIVYLSVYPEKPYRLNGFLFSFCANLEYCIITPPSGYSEKKMANIAKEIQANISDQPNFFTPDIIVYLNESFWDITQMDTIKFDKDPIEFYRTLSENYTNGDFVPCSTGGGTANVEFEILSGLSTKNLPYGTTAYIQYVRQPINSIPEFLHQNGYSTTAIHTYDKTFYNRDEAYKNMGFQNFIGAQDIDEPIMRGNFISDEELVNQIIKTLETVDAPAFVHAVSMQNHMSYYKDKYPKHYATISTPKLSDEKLAHVQTYTDGLHYADESLKQLVTYLENTSRPTALLFFGDHFPAINIDKQLYVDLEYISSANSYDWNIDDILKTYNAPFIIWTNYETVKQTPPKMSSANLGNYFLEYIGIKKPVQFYFNDIFYSKFPVYSHSLIMDNTNKILPTIPNESKSIDNIYKLIQYDLLFGKGYLLRKE